MTSVKTQENQEKSNALEIKHSYSRAVTEYFAGVSIYADEAKIVTIFDEQRVLDQIKIYAHWSSNEPIPQPHIEVHSFRMLKSGKADDRSHKRADYDPKYMEIGLTPEMLEKAVAAYYAEAQKAVK